MAVGHSAVRQGGRREAMIVVAFVSVYNGIKSELPGAVRGWSVSGRIRTID